MEASAKGLTRWEISDLYSPPALLEPGVRCVRFEDAKNLTLRLRVASLLALVDNERDD